MAEETRNALLYAQLQEGLKYALMKAPAVFGAQGYQELCVAARNEERRLNELNSRKQYLWESALKPGRVHLSPGQTVNAKGLGSGHQLMEILQLDLSISWVPAH